MGVQLKLLDRYILEQLRDYFLLSLVIFSLVAFFSDTLLDFIQDVHIPLSTLITIIGLQLPKTIALVIPASSFLAVLMVYNNLNNNFEIISFRTTGISLNRLLVPALIVGVLSTVVTYFLYDFAVPYCNKQTELLKQDAMRKGNLPFGRKSFMYKTYDDKHNMKQMIYVSSYDGNQLGDSTIIDLAKPGVMQIVQAKSGSWDAKDGWLFNNANIYVVASKSEHSSAGHSGSFAVKNLINSVDEQKLLEEDRQRQVGGLLDSSTQSFWTMFQVIKQREEFVKTRGPAWKVSRKSYINLWERWTLPLSCIVIILSAVALAITPPRQGSNRGFIFALMVLFLYYVLRSSAVALGRAKFFTLGGLLPLNYSLILAAWSPILILALLGAGLLWRKSRVL